MTRESFGIIALMAMAATSSVQCSGPTHLTEAYSPPDQIILTIDSAGTLTCGEQRLDINAPDIEGTLREQLLAITGPISPRAPKKVTVSLHFTNPEALTFGQCVRVLIACGYAADYVQFGPVTILMHPNRCYQESVQGLPMQIASPDELARLYENASAFEERTVVVSPTDGSRVDQVIQVLLVLDDLGAAMHIFPQLDPTESDFIELRSLVERTDPIDLTRRRSEDIPRAIPRRVEEDVPTP